MRPKSFFNFLLIYFIATHVPVNTQRLKSFVNIWCSNQARKPKLFSLFCLTWWYTSTDSFGMRSKFDEKEKRRRKHLNDRMHVMCSCQQLLVMLVLYAFFVFISNMSRIWSHCIRMAVLCIFAVHFDFSEITFF